MKLMNKIVRSGIVIAVLLSALGCTRHVSRDISMEGQAAEVIFPASDRLVLQEGTFVTVDHVAQIGYGMTKDQLYALLGRPHFREGFAAREWDYLLHFRESDERVRTCQYKVIFDTKYLAQSFHWFPASCGEFSATAGAPEVVEVPTAQLSSENVRRIQLSGDALFPLGRHATKDMLEGGREQVASIAQQVRGDRAAKVQVIGHTDYLGSNESNLVLSLRRAEAVRSILLAYGVSEDAVEVFGIGETVPIKQCAAGLPRVDLVDCLQPNRRVEIVVTTRRE